MTDEAAAGGTSIAVGLFTEAGAEIDLDGLLTATNGATANLGANVDLAGTGALLGTAVTQKGYIGITTVGTYTAGKGRVLIRYTLGRSV
jgi:hypothetical protein